MRGVAAVMVMLFHFNLALSPFLAANYPFISDILSYGYLGVPIFFVISGFVISLTVNLNEMGSKYVGKFILRRSIRLDIVYWLSIAIAIFLLVVESKVTNETLEMYSTSEVLIHMFYLQNILDLENQISMVYWTLCLEVQFYLFFILSLLTCKALFKDKADIVFCFAIGLPLAVYSILVDLRVLKELYTGLFFSQWHYFFLGYLCERFFRQGGAFRMAFFAWAICLLGFMLFLHAKPYTIAAMLTAAFIVLMRQYQFKARFLTNSWMLYLGSISYPLYVLHADLGWKVMSFSKIYVPVESLLNMLFVLMVGVVVSVIASHLMHIWVEKPSIKLSKKVR
ncbi:acyltransferase [Alteromonas sp. ASW11-36]|uniref:Acyltransferase n=2 Tax=Alteromonas arenosi TaxID=3055817 RepID=A0ABT7STB4_9ALTE|nr:acyltransferase [Alteromonas sp. ASW11-36]MDM7859437.1 acyltransferase [Alteromonas sp. ASW11-36]